MNDFTNEQLKEIALVFNGFNGDEKRSIGKVASNELERREELDSIFFEDGCESCKL